MSSDTPPPPAGPQPGPGATPPDRPRRERPPHKFEKRPQALDAEQAVTGPRIRDLDKLVETELDHIMAGLDAKDLYGEERRGKAAAPEGPRKGRVVMVRNQDVFVEMPGQRSQGLMALQQFDTPPKVGDEVEYEVERFDSANGLLLLSKPGAAAVQVDWSSVSQGMVVEARVTGVNKGGLAVEVNGIRGFMPISQIDLYRVEVPEQFLNQRLKCVIAEVSPEDRNLVVSRRALMEREREAKRDEFWGEIAEGQTRPGTVKSIKPFGVFVDLGGADGLIPVSELSWSKVSDPSQVVSPGHVVQVRVMKVDPATRKIGLSLRALLASPWDTLAERMNVGSRVTGSVTRIADYGAFVELEPGVEGLIHVSELSPQRVRRVRDVVREGQAVEVVILSIDREQRRIALSLKAAIAKPEPAAPEPEPEEPAAPAKPPKPRTYTLRGGTGEGGDLFKLPGS
jgi:small subunit ribosomal protein S1